MHKLYRKNLFCDVHNNISVHKTTTQHRESSSKDDFFIRHYYAVKQRNLIVVTAPAFGFQQDAGDDLWIDVACFEKLDGAHGVA